MNDSKSAAQNQRPRRELPVVNMTDAKRADWRKDYYLPTGKGKTARLLAIAEFTRSSIICASDTRRRHIQAECKRWGYKIPAIFTASELVSGRLIGTNRSDYVVDDSGDVLQNLISGLSGGKANVIATAYRMDEECDEFD